MNENGDHRIDRLFCALIVFIGFVSSAAILVSLYVLTEALDRQGVSSTATLPTALPGSQFRQLALPWVLSVCVGLVLLTIWIGVSFRRLLRRLEKVQVVAMTDHLTGVSNRTALTALLRGDLVQTALKNGHLAVISLDVDNLKRLNDEFGHQAGDAALKVTAERLSSSVRRQEKVLRMGGDEFLCLVFDPDPNVAAEKVMERLKVAFDDPVDLGGFSQNVSLSIGVAVANRGETWEAILTRSDAEMYRAKRSKTSDFSGQGGDSIVTGLKSYASG